MPRHSTLWGLQAFYAFLSSRAYYLFPIFGSVLPLRYLWERTTASWSLGAYHRFVNFGCAPSSDGGHATSSSDGRRAANSHDDGHTVPPCDGGRATLSSYGGRAGLSCYGGHATSSSKMVCARRSLPRWRMYDALFQDGGRYHFVNFGEYYHLESLEGVLPIRELWGVLPPRELGGRTTNSRALGHTTTSRSLGAHYLFAILESVLSPRELGGSTTIS
ncbi:hypothetical protein COLO4_27216 [Corchorus olitorius]|uniref:Uncharacterized protein n=1 Tax=Corchorus olitorius TaxID=93759 RepID=A0A1R3HSM2_9ROSI|nr:hypothetical protein COLO4_27216 [Corchorus olitorius]